MRNFITPNSHPSSFLTGSTVESMVNKFKELGTGYCVCTDNGTLTNAFKVYNLAKKKELKPIIGCEIYFVDNECEILNTGKAKKIKYRTLTLHAKNQEAYQYLVKKISEKDRSTITILEQEYPTFNWKDLEDFSKHDFTAVIGGPQDIVCKNLLVQETVVAGKTFLKLLNIFKNNLYCSVIPLKMDKKWVTQTTLFFSNGTEAKLNSNFKVETAFTKNFRVSLEEVGDNFSKHKIIKRIYVNGIGYKVSKELIGAFNTKMFKDIGVDIYQIYNSFIKKVANQYNVKILINDYSYLADNEDKLVQDLKLGDELKMYTVNSIKTTESVKENLLNIFTEEELLGVINNTHEWASNFDSFSLSYNYRMVKEHENTLSAAMQLIKQIGRFDAKNPVHRERLKHEIDVIHANGQIDLLPYFFPISKVLNYYAEQGRVVGPARGSAGGSFLLYCMGITQIDPIKYGLYFSRFLTLGRILKGTLPDVDVDLPDRDMLTSENGFLNTFYKDRWAQISTRSLMRLKSSIKDVNRYKKGKVEPEIEILTKKLEAAPQGISDQDFVFGYEDNDGNHIPGILDKDTSLQDYVKQRPEEWEIVKRSLGMSRQNGRHASAFVISDIPITDTVPIFKVGGVDDITQYEAKEIEAAGLIKYDFLIVKCLNDIELAIKLINEEYFYNKGNKGGFKAGYFFHKGDIVDIWNLPEEQEVFNMLAEGKTETIFQLNTISVTPYVEKIKPKSVEDCAVITSLVRPGPLDFIDEKTGRNMAEEYIERVRGRSKGEIPILDRLIPETHGVMCISKGSKVKTSEGQVNIEDVKEGAFVQVSNGEFRKVLKNIYQGKKQTIKVRLDNSEELNLTPDHAVLTQRGWVEAGSLTSNDLVKHFWVSDNIIEEGSDKDWIIGMLLADGQLNQSTYNIAAGTEDKAKKIKKIIDTVFDIDCQIYHHTRCWYVRTTNKDYVNKVSNNQRKNPLKEYCKSIGIDGLNCYDKRFPSKITKKMIEGFIEGDGNIKNKRIRICNEKMARQIFETLQAMRIKSSLFEDKGVWTVGFNQSKLNYKIKTKTREVEKDIYVPKQSWTLERSDNRRQHFFPKKMIKKPFIQKSLAESIAVDYGFFLPKDTWSKVLTIKSDTIKDVYDLSIDEIHNFVVGGNVVHNCFQEQIVKITKDMTGWDDEKAEDVRIAVGKKQLKMIMELKPQFIEASIANDIDAETAQNVWGMIETFGRYGFNKSHAVAYAMIAYACAYLKYHYPLEWWASVLSNAEEKEITEVLWPHVKDIVSAPDINKSNEEMYIDYSTGKIRGKLSILKGLGPKAADKIKEERPYKDIKDFVMKKTVGNSMAKKLIHVGVLDSLFPSDYNLMDKMQAFEDAVEERNYREKIHKKSGGEIDTSLPIEEVIKLAKTNPKTIKSRNYIQKGRVDNQYIWMTPIQDYIVKKSILPTMAADLFSVIQHGVKNVKVISTEKNIFAISPSGRETRVITGKQYNTIKNLPCDPNNNRYVNFCVAAYVIEAVEFGYGQDNEKKALRLILDIDGYSEELVRWPDYDTGKLEYPENLTKNSVIFLFMHRKMNKEKYHTNIDYIVVEANFG